jgi:hypothetical protein
VAVVQEIDEARSQWIPSLWEIPLDGGSPDKLINSPYGQTSPVFLPDNSLIYVSAQPWPEGGSAGEPALWLLTEGGQARPLAGRAGGLTAPLVARDSGAMIAVGQRLSRLTADNDAVRRAVRRGRRVSAVIHSWMPVRDPFRDHDIEYPQLLFSEPSGAGPLWRDLAPDGDKAMVKLNPLSLTERSISAGGDRVVVMWGTPRPCGAFPYSIALIETATGKRTAIAAGSDLQYTSPQIAPDGRRVAAMAIAEGTFDTPVGYGLHVFDVSEPGAIGAPAEVSLGDLYPVEWAWAPSSDVLYVSATCMAAGRSWRSIRSPAMCCGGSPATRSTPSLPPRPTGSRSTRSDRRPTRPPLRCGSMSPRPTSARPSSAIPRRSRRYRDGWRK